MARRIGICADHGGRDLKRLVEDFLKLTSHELIDYGISYENHNSVDYPDYAELLAMDISNSKIDLGIAICGTGIGMSMVANKFSGVRAAVVTCEFSARMSRMHNNANILCLGARTINHFRAVDFTKIWLETEFEGGRHDQRLAKIRKIEQRNFAPRR
jgi:ribose 5-phosphate isomerase B